jgi:hypothetical protein
VYVNNAACVTISHSFLCDNGHCGLEVFSSGHTAQIISPDEGERGKKEPYIQAILDEGVRVESSDISHNNGSGVLAAASVCSFQGCELTDNRQANLSVLQSSDVFIHSCNLVRSLSSGIYVKSVGSCVYVGEGCVVKDNHKEDKETDEGGTIVDIRY